MSEQEQQRSRHTSQETTDSEEVEVDTEARESIEFTDDLLDEIDSVLEENAEEMVKNYVQKGGQ